MLAATVHEVIWYKVSSFSHCRRSGASVFYTFVIACEYHIASIDRARNLTACVLICTCSVLLTPEWQGQVCSEGTNRPFHMRCETAVARP